jgi:hypothetical protein
MREAAHGAASSGLFCLALFLIIAVAGLLHVEHRMRQARERERNQVDG